MVMLYSFTVNMVGAALRLGIHQHHDGQRIIHELKPDILRIVQKCIDRPVSRYGSSLPELILCSQNMKE
jgi:urease accessory protein